jgi:flavin-dependent dehydrogenase
MAAEVDIAIIGAGPAGSIAALCAARAGLRAIALEKTSHPRFHIGESLLPRTLAQLRALGLEDRLRRLPQTKKMGASMVWADAGEPVNFPFSMSLGRHHEAFNIERALFDAMLAAAARDAGADVRESDPVDEIEHLAEGDVRVQARSGEVRARLLLDASGQSSVLGRRFKTRRPLEGLANVAYFDHFTGVKRREGELGGMPVFPLVSEGWFWLIPLDETRTSVGMVIRAEAAKRAGAPAGRMLEWGVSRTPVMRQLMAGCDLSRPNQVISDYSYSCAPYAGPGWAMLGDAATFIDPVFSTGVCLGTMGAEEAVRLAPAMMAGGAGGAAARGQYERFVRQASGQYLRLVRGFYTQAFRELFMTGHGPLQMHRAVMTALAGDLFPQASLGVRWRLGMFELCRRAQMRVALAPRRRAWSLLEAEAPGNAGDGAAAETASVVEVGALSTAPRGSDVSTSSIGAAGASPTVAATTELTA